MKKEQVDLAKRTVFITDSKTPAGVAEVPQAHEFAAGHPTQIAKAAVAGPAR